VAAYRRAGLVIFGKTNTPGDSAWSRTTEPAMFGPTRNPVGPGAHRRLVRRFGGGGGGGHRAGGPRQRRRRLDPHPRLVLRPLRAEAVARPRLDGAEGRGLGRLLLRPARGQPHGARQRAAARRRRPAGAGRSLLDRAARRARSLPDAGRDPAPLRIAFTTAALSSAGGSIRSAPPRSRDAAKLCADLGHHVEEAEPPIDRASLAAAGTW
jgi:amidase